MRRLFLMLCVCMALSTEELQAQVDGFLRDGILPLPSGVALTRRPQHVSFSTARIAPPAPFYLSLEDRLRISWWNQIPVASLRVSGRMLDEQGEMRIFVFTFPMAVSLNRQSEILALGEGFLLNLGVRAVQLSPAQEQAFVSLTVIRGPAALAVELSTLIQSYVGRAFFPSWPAVPPRDSVEGPGLVISHTVAAPAVGADWAFTIDERVAERIVGVTGTLTTNATAANRTVQLVYTDTAGNDTLFLEAAAVQPASTTRRYTWHINAPYAAVTTVIQHAPLPDILLKSTWAISTLTDNLQVGDQWSGLFVTAERWLNPTD